MQTRRLGKTGFQIGEIGLGCWQLGGDFGPLAQDRAEAILAAAARGGINFWDTADVYGGGLSEERIGGFGGKPENLTIATKVGRSPNLYPDGYSKEGLRQSLQASAARLGANTIDLAQLHCIPPQVMRDGEVFNWLEDLKREGLIRHYGASVETIDEARLCLQQEGLATLQIIFNIFRQDAAGGLLDEAREKDVGVIVRLPLASGLLSGKFTRDTQFDPSDHRHFNRDGEAFNVGETFGGIPFEKGLELAEGLRGLLSADAEMAQWALRWILDHEAVSTVIAGVSRPQQIESNIRAAELPSLTAAQHEKLSKYYRQQVKPNIRGEI